jgi:hypothetical protein
MSTAGTGVPSKLDVARRSRIACARGFGFLLLMVLMSY